MSIKLGKDTIAGNSSVIIPTTSLTSIVDPNTNAIYHLTQKDQSFVPGKYIAEIDEYGIDWYQLKEESDTLEYLTTAPTEDNTSGTIKMVLLDTEPATYYDGYAYYIYTEEHNYKYYICVGNSGVSYYTQDQETWIPMTGLPNTFNAAEVAFGNNRFVCVGNEGQSYYSVDGKTWVAMTGLPNLDFKSVCFGYGTFVCIGERGTAYKSTNGTTWSLAGTLDTSKTFNKVRYFNNKFISVGPNGSGYWTSNLSTWTAMSGLTDTNNVIALAAVQNMIFTLDSGGRVYYSNDGMSWIYRNNYNSYQELTSVGDEICISGINNNGSILFLPGSNYIYYYPRSIGDPSRVHGAYNTFINLCSNRDYTLFWRLGSWSPCNGISTTDILNSATGGIIA